MEGGGEFLSVNQTNQVRQLAMEAAQQAFMESNAAATTNLNATRESMIKSAEEFAARDTAQRAEHQKITEDIANQQRELSTLVEQLKQHAIMKDTIIADLDKKQQVMQSLNAEVQAQIFEQTGGWRGQVDVKMNEIKITFDNFKEYSHVTDRTLEELKSHAVSTMSSSPGLGSAGYGSSTKNLVDRAGKWAQRGLIFEKELKVP